MWLLILIAVSVNNPQDVRGTISIEFPSHVACESALKSMQYSIFTKLYKMEGQCVPKKS